MRALVSMVLLCCFAVPLAAQERFVVVTDLWPPYRIDWGDGVIGGIDIDLLKLLEAKLKVRFVVQRAPWVRCLEMMKSGDADLMTGLAKTDERAVYTEFVSPAYDVVRPAFYTHKTKGITIKTYNDLRSLSIGFTRGSAYFEPFDSDRTLQKTDVTEEAQLLGMLTLDRIDALVGTDPQVDYDIRHRGLEQDIVKSPYQPDSTTALYLAISKKSSFLSREAELGAALATLVSDGTIRKIVNGYVK